MHCGIRALGRAISRSTHPDVLQVLAVDGVDDAVRADELDSAVDVDIYYCAALTVLREEEGI